MNPTLQELIADAKGTRSYRAIADASNGLSKKDAIQAIATRANGGFPTADMLNGLATALNLPINAIVIAAATSAGLNTSAPQAPAELHESVYYWQQHTATYRTRYQALRDRLTA